MSAWTAQDFCLAFVLLFLALIVGAAYVAHWHDKNYRRIPPQRVNDCRPGCFSMRDFK
jgi:hypothetical protein